MKGLDRHLRCVKDSKYLSYAALKGFCVCLATAFFPHMSSLPSTRLAVQGLAALEDFRGNGHSSMEVVPGICCKLHAHA